MQREFIVNGRRIEAAWHGQSPEQAPTLVLLHEGLGSVAMWRDFPATLAKHTGYGVLAYSRPGYGKSDPVPLPRPLSYMHDEAFETLPAILDQAKVKKTILVGHSDGGSIATIYAGGSQDFRVRGLVLMAPHFFCEDISVQSIAAAKEAYEKTDLRARLARYHDNVDVAFWGWNQSWLHPEFRHWNIGEYLPTVRVPMLIIQGREDQYGTPAQLELAQKETYCPVEVLLLDRCRHSPHVDQSDVTLSSTSDFCHRVLALHEGEAPAHEGTRGRLHAF